MWVFSLWRHKHKWKKNDTFILGVHIFMPPPHRGGGGGIKRSSVSVVRLSIRLSVCLMLHTSALTRKPKGLGRWNFAQGYPSSHATPTPTSRSKGQRSRSAGAGAYCSGHLAAQLVLHVVPVHRNTYLLTRVRKIAILTNISLYLQNDMR